MVAIVVLSGVVYVWAAQLADTDTKGVPRVTFDATTSILAMLTGPLEDYRRSSTDRMATRVKYQ